MERVACVLCHGLFAVPVGVIARCCDGRYTLGLIGLKKIQKGAENILMGLRSKWQVPRECFALGPCFC